MEKIRFLHIPKTGGSTLRKNLDNPDLKIPLKVGHEIKYKKGDLNITIIRNPLNRTISHYNEVRNNNVKEIKFKDWFKERYYDFQTKWLLDKTFLTEESKKLNKHNFDKLLLILDKFYFILITRQLDKDMEKLFSVLEIKRKHKNINVSKKRYKLSDEEKKVILNKNKYDLMLYDYILGKREIV